MTIYLCIDKGVSMKCKICNLEIEKQFYYHLNRHHTIGGGSRSIPKKMTIKHYFELFPEQKEEYENQKCKIWNKGLTKETSVSVMKGAIAVKKHTNQPEVRKERSDRMKKRYEEGDILDTNTRKRVAKNGSDGWVRKIKSVTKEDRLSLLHNFVTAGNKSQKDHRSELTPEDYMRLYPWAKGVARYYDCDFCGNKMIAWFGGKPRSRKRFCGNECWFCYQKDHPMYILSQVGQRYYSSKMEMEFFLRSNLEMWFAKVLDCESIIYSWSTSPFHIPYEWDMKIRKYTPDFFVNNRYVIEIKSDYILRMSGTDKTRKKLMVAENWCYEKGYEFIYWQFDGSSRNPNFVIKDERVVGWLNELKRKVL